MKIVSDVLFLFPPFCWVIKKSSPLSADKILSLHFRLLGGLYSLLFFVSLFDGALYIQGGIGVVQNPPFWAHLITAFSSLAIIIKIAENIRRIFNDSSGKLQVVFYEKMSASNIKSAIFKACALVAIGAYAYNIVLAASYKVDIYDSTSHLSTFILYSLVRAYIYLCYAITVSTILNAILFLTISLKKTSIKYSPFHEDKAGGLRKYFDAIDKPIYFLQSLSAVIVVANYVGWGSFSFTPNMLATAVLLVISIIAFMHFLSFRLVVKTKLKLELHNLRTRQYEVYQSIISNGYDKERLKSYVDELESTERLISLINKKPKKGWGKYLANLIPPLIFNFDKLTGNTLYHYVQDIISSFPP